MATLEELRERIPEPARDLKVNLQQVLEAETPLSPAQRWGTAVACALATRNRELSAAVLEAAKAHVEPAVLEDARAAASIMGMNNVYYRFRHMVGKGYTERPARLRMTRIARPATNRTDFELFCIAVSALNGCEACMKSHEETVLHGGLTEEHVHDAVRIAAVLQGAAIALE